MIVEEIKYTKIQEKTFDKVISRTPALILLSTDKEFVISPRWDLDDMKLVDDSIKENIERSGIECLQVTKGGGATVLGEGDIAYSIVSSDVEDSQILDFFNNYFKDHGYENSSIIGNDIIVNNKKVIGVAHIDYPDFGMRITVGMVTLTDHQETFDKLFSQFYGTDNYKMPGFIPLDKEDLISAFVEFLNSLEEN